MSTPKKGQRKQSPQRKTGSAAKMQAALEVLARHPYLPFAFNNSPDAPRQRRDVERAWLIMEKGLGDSLCQEYRRFAATIEKRVRRGKPNAYADRMARGLKMLQAIVAEQKARKIVRDLTLSAGRGDGRALYSIWRIAVDTVHALEEIEELQGEAVRKEARQCKTWPVMASRTKGNLLALQRRLDALQLGDDLNRPRNRNASNAPSRRYADEVFATLDAARDIQIHLRDSFACGATPKVKICGPKWAGDCALLPDFKDTPKSLKAWSAAAVAMLKAECPDLIDRPEWSAFKKQTICDAKPFGGLRAGTMQARIIDRILRSLRRLVAK